MPSKNDTVKLNNAWVWAGGGLLVLAAATVLYLRYRKNKSPQSVPAAARLLGASRSAGTTTGFCRHGDRYPLRVGSCGNNVTALQKRLIAMGMDLGPYGPKKDGVDGKYGKRTEAAVKKLLGRATVTVADLSKLTP